MEGSHIGNILALVVAAGVVAGGALKMDINSKKSELTDARYSADIARKSLEEKLAALAEAKKKVESLQSSLDANKSLRDGITSLQAKRSEILEQFVDVVRDTRNRAIGVVFPEVPVAGGRALQTATVQKVTNTEITFAHTGGVTKVAVGDLPAAIREKYRMDMFPMTLADLPIQSVAGIAVPGTVAKSPSAPMPQAAPPTAVSKDNPEHLRIDIDNLYAKVNALERSKVAWFERLTSLRAQLDTLQRNGKPSYNAGMEVKQAEKNAAAVEQQITYVQSQITILRKKLADALAPPKL